MGAAVEAGDKWQFSVYIRIHILFVAKSQPYWASLIIGYSKHRPKCQAAHWASQKMSLNTHLILQPHPDWKKLSSVYTNIWGRHLVVLVYIFWSDCRSNGSYLSGTSSTDRFLVASARKSVFKQPGIEQPGIEQPGIEQPGVEQSGVE
jgi:hypothetical protein